MTLDEFLSQFEILVNEEKEGKWIWDDCGRVRFVSGENNEVCECPICFVANRRVTGKVFSNDEFEKAGRSLKLSYKNVLDIIEAADSSIPDHKKAMILREKLKTVTHEREME